MSFNQLTFLIKLSLISFGVLALAVGIPYTRTNLIANSNKKQLTTVSVLAPDSISPTQSVQKTSKAQSTTSQSTAKKTQMGQQLNNTNAVADSAKPPVSSNNLPSAVDPVIVPTSPPDLFSQLSSHNNQSDCWVTYKNHLYDITPYFGQHPGGSAIMALFCGRAMDLAYDTKNFIPGQAHSSRADQLLQTFLIQ